MTGFHSKGTGYLLNFCYQNIDFSSLTQMEELSGDAYQEWSIIIQAINPMFGNACLVIPSLSSWRCWE